MATQPQPRLTEEQYLNIERTAACRSEFFDGRMFAMAGGSFEHMRLKDTMAMLLASRLAGRNCVTGTSDMRVRVSATGLYTYPDVLVICGEPKFLDGSKDTLLNPTLIAEVLSPSSTGYDRGSKFAHYRSVDSLQEYVVIFQNEARVEVYRRQPGGGWLLTEASGRDAGISLGSLDCSIPLGELYAGISFEE